MKDNMKTTYKVANEDQNSVVAEPATVGYATRYDRRALSISVPGNDVLLAQEMIKRMGWIVMETPQPMPSEKKKSVRKALNELRGCISLPADFDYKNEIHAALAEKYGMR